jgi:hypothetical protein
MVIGNFPYGLAPLRRKLLAGGSRRRFFPYGTVLIALSHHLGRYCNIADAHL